MKENLIQSALTAQLVTLAKTTQWENADFAPTAQNEYIRPTFLPSRTRAAAIGVDAQDRVIGVYQVDTFSPLNGGVKANGELVSLIMQAFKRGTALSYGGVTVLITKVWRSGKTSETKWYSVPVIVEWRADVDV